MGSNEQDKKSKPAKGGKGLSGEKDRGTQDDIEILKLILDENPALRQRVLDKMRAIRKMNKL